MNISRRSILTGAASLTILSGASFTIPQLTKVNAQIPRIRYDARSAQGKAMLKLYAKAVAKMREASVAGTSSDWTFQWYTHAVSGTTSKLAELDRMYPNPNDPNRLLATLTWDTCEAHHPGTVTANFAPWHRAFVLLFEEIVREAVEDDSFTLPYWDYTDDAVLPNEFMLENNAEFGSLYVDRRYSDVNQGTAIDQRNGAVRPESLNLDSLKEGSYLGGVLGIPPGFNRKLDGELHGFVHVNVGDPTNMGDIPFAAYDPIFWLHHCNIDRIWAAWNAYGGQNPTSDDWAKDQKHVFADAQGNRREITNSEVTDLTLLGYNYDKLPPKPDAGAIVVAGGALASSKKEGEKSLDDISLAQTKTQIALGNNITPVTLSRPASAALSVLTSRPTDPAKRRYLVVEGLQSNVQPGIHYDVIAKSTSDTTSTPSEELYIGSINFFDAVTSNGVARTDLKFVFDVTDKLTGKEETDPFSYFIVPSGIPVGDALPVVGTIRLVEK